MRSLPHSPRFYTHFAPKSTPFHQQNPPRQNTRFIDAILHIRLTVDHFILSFSSVPSLLSDSSFCLSSFSFSSLIPLHSSVISSFNTSILPFVSCESLLIPDLFIAAFFWHVLCNFERIKFLTIIIISFFETNSASKYNKPKLSTPISNSRYGCNTTYLFKTAIHGKVNNIIQIIDFMFMPFKNTFISFFISMP